MKTKTNTNNPFIFYARATSTNVSVVEIDDVAHARAPYTYVPISLCPYALFFCIPIKTGLILGLFFRPG